MSIEEIIRGEARKNLSPSSSEEVAPKEESTKTTDDQYKPQLVQVPSKPLESVEPVTDISGLAGAVTRGTFPTAAEAAIGGGLGFLVAGPPGALVGAAAAPLAADLADLTVSGVNAYFGTNFGTARGALTKILDSVGTPEPDTAAERIVQAVTEGAAGAGGTAALASKAGKALQEGSKIQKVAKFMGEKPLEQLAAGTIGAGASATAREMGAGVGTQLLAGLAGGFVPSAAGKVKSIVAPTKEALRAEAEQAVRSIYETSFPTEEARNAAIEQLKQSGKINDEDVKLLVGEITYSKPLLALQAAMERSNQEVANQVSSNVAGVARKVAKGLERTDISPAETEMFFKKQLDQLRKETEDAAEALKTSGQVEQQAMLDDARNVFDEQTALAEAGEITAEQAYNNTKAKLDEAFLQKQAEKYQGPQGELIKEPSAAVRKDVLSEEVANTINQQRVAAKSQAQKLYNEIQDVDPFQQPNTQKAIDEIVAKIPEGRGGKKDIPPIIQDIYANITDELGGLKFKKLLEPLEWRKKLNDRISQAIRSGDEVTSRQLKIVKDAIDKDLKTLKVYPQIKKADKFYAEYSDIFKSGAAEEAFDEGESLTKVVGQYIPKSSEKLTKDELIRLRKSIEGHPEVPRTPELDALTAAGFDKLDTWIYGQAIDAMKENQTSKSLKKWINDNGSRIFDAFEGSPSTAKEKVNKLIAQFEDLEEQELRAKFDLNIAKNEARTRGDSAQSIRKESERMAKAIKETKDKEASRILAEFEEQNIPSKNPANKFIGANAEDVIGNIISSGDSQSLAQVLQRASQDTTGKATEGLKNAAKKWINKNVRNENKPTIKEGIPDEVLNVDNLEVELGKANALLGQDTEQRKVLEMLFGKDSKEIQALDKSRQFLDAMKRKTTLSVGEMLKPNAKTGEITDTLLAIGAIGFANVKGYIAWKGIDLIRKLNKEAKRDVGEIFSEMLSKSLTDPDVAIQMMTPITKENWPNTKRFLRSFGIQARSVDFGIDENSEDENQSESSKPNPSELLPY